MSLYEELAAAWVPARHSWLYSRPLGRQLIAALAGSEARGHAGRGDGGGEEEQRAGSRRLHHCCCGKVPGWATGALERTIEESGQHWIGCRTLSVWGLACGGAQWVTEAPPDTILRGGVGLLSLSDLVVGFYPPTKGALPNNPTN